MLEAITYQNMLKDINSNEIKEDKSLKDISNAFGKDKLIQVTKENILKNIPSSLANVFYTGKIFQYFRRNQMEQQFYEQIKRILFEARNKVYQTEN